MCALAYIRKHMQTGRHTHTQIEAKTILNIRKYIFPFMSALETVTETKWDPYLYGKKWISCVGDVLATFPKLWFDL